MDTIQYAYIRHGTVNSARNLGKVEARKILITVEKQEIQRIVS